MALATTSVSGLISGLDTASIIEQLMAIERRPITLLENDMAEAEAQKKAFTTVNTSLLALRTAADELARDAFWLSRTTSVSDESVLSATAASGTPLGTYTFTVGQLAAASQLASNGYADADTTPVGSGSFDLTVAGVTETINVGAADTLNDVAAAINAKDMGATALVLNTGAAGTPYKLIITSNQTGIDNAAEIDNNSTGMAFTEITEARNAILQFGTDNPITVESATNTITGLAQGLTLDLKSASASPVTVTVESDTTGILEQARDFVEKYNEVQSNIEKYTDYDEDAEAFAVLFGNSTLRFVSMDLAYAVGSQVDGVAPEVNSMMMAGFDLDGQGALSLDEDVFTEALDANMQGLSEMFSGVMDRALAASGATAAGPAAEAGYSVDGVINGNVDEDDFGAGNGFLSANTIAADGGSHVFTVDFGGNKSIKQLFLYTPVVDGISDFTVELQRADGSWQLVETVTGFSGDLWADVLADPLLAQAMRVTVTGTNAADDKTRILEIKANEEAGVAHRLSNVLDFVTRGVDGAIATEQEALDDRIRDIEEQIEDLEERMLAKEERLRAEFLAMEQALAQMQTQSEYFMSQLASLNNLSS